jgi:hypothetical protein
MTPAQTINGNPGRFLKLETESKKKFGRWAVVRIPFAMEEALEKAFDSLAYRAKGHVFARAHWLPLSALHECANCGTLIEIANSRLMLVGYGKYNKAAEYPVFIGDRRKKLKPCPLAPSI